MDHKPVPLTAAQLEALAQQYPTPFYLYDERGIRQAARGLNAAFAWNTGFREYFAVDRRLPHVEVGDLVLIHDAGAHGHAMGFNYNGKLRSAELLLQPDGQVRMIRRAETIEDYFATLDFGEL